MQDAKKHCSWSGLLGCSAALIISSAASAQTGGSGGLSAIQWQSAVGGNGHWYAVIQNAKAFDVAKKYAADNGGHLVTITSEAEQNWVKNYVLSRLPQSPEQKVWIGARAANGSCTTVSAYYWVNGEAFGYHAFMANEPGNPAECGVAMRRGGQNNGKWSSEILTQINKSIVEWDADCNEDGHVDYGQIALGYLVDNNQNFIPDCCELGVDCCPDGRLPDQNGCGGSVVNGDCNGNGRCDSQEVDCNNNGKPDDCDISCGTSQDCQPAGAAGHGVPDECDIANGTSDDCNRNAIPDECECCDHEPDGVLDQCEPDPMVVIVEDQTEGCGQDYIYYTVKVINPPFRLVAGQFNVEYDTALYEFVGVQPGVNAGYNFGIPFVLHDGATGDLLWYSALPPNSDGTFYDSVVAKLKFRAVGNNCPLKPNDPIECRWQAGTRCTITGIANGQDTLNITVPTVNPGHVVIDGAAPEFTTPPIERITVQADAGIPCQAVVAMPYLPVASDNCSGVTITPVRSDGKPLNAPFNCGTTYIGWNAYDACGNKRTMNTEVIVNPWNVCNVTIAWDTSKRDAQGACNDVAFSGSVTRCIELRFSTGTGPEGECYTTEQEFTFNNGVATGPVLVPGADGVWTEACADDNLHSLSTTSQMHDDGAQYSIAFVGEDAMLLGDFDDNNCIDAADYAIWTVRAGDAAAIHTDCDYVVGAALYHADLDGNGYVGPSDADRLLCNAATCGDDLTGNCGGGHLAGSNGPIMALDVATMSALIGADASAADVNGDGIIDGADMGLVGYDANPIPAAKSRK